MAYALNGIKIDHDISYGVYIYHMIVINAMIQIGLTHHNVYFFTALFISVILGFISYFTLGVSVRNRKKLDNTNIKR